MNTEAAFFDSCALNWDTIRNENPLILQQLIELADIHPGERILDVGSGTGVLLPYLHKKALCQGKITAVDFSSCMLAKAKEKCKHFPEVSFKCADIMKISLPLNFYNTIICLNFFPHLGTYKKEYIEKMYSALCSDGKLIIMHDISRAKVNSLHENCREVCEDRLPPAACVAHMLETAQYHNIVTIDNDNMYFVMSKKQAGK
jgi:CsoR family transcriptional regulator, copper-sensing transcriptional repressor